MAALDPYNWPTAQKGDLMSLSTLSQMKDLCRVKTAGATLRGRHSSQNLETADIEGKQSLVTTLRGFS